MRRSGTLRVAAPLAQAFPFFTPDGERLWVPGFDPQYLHPLSGEQGVGAIFTTAHGGEDTLWMVLRFSPSEGVAEYARVTPGSRGGTVQVALEPVDAATTQATITYDLTSTSEAGDEKLGVVDRRRVRRDAGGLGAKDRPGAAARLLRLTSSPALQSAHDEACSRVAPGRGGRVGPRECARTTRRPMCRVPPMAVPISRRRRRACPTAGPIFRASGGSDAALPARRLRLPRRQRRLRAGREFITWARV